MRESENVSSLLSDASGHEDRRRQEDHNHSSAALTADRENNHDDPDEDADLVAEGEKLHLRPIDQNLCSDPRLLFLLGVAAPPPHFLSGWADSASIFG